MALRHVGPMTVDRTGRNGPVGFAQDSSLPSGARLLIESNLGGPWVGVQFRRPLRIQPADCRPTFGTECGSKEEDARHQILFCWARWRRSRACLLERWSGRGARAAESDSLLMVPSSLPVVASSCSQVVDCGTDLG